MEVQSGRETIMKKQEIVEALEKAIEGFTDRIEEVSILIENWDREYFPTDLKEKRAEYRGSRKVLRVVIDMVKGLEEK